MIDIVTTAQGLDLGVADTVAPRATNILAVQIGDLEYLPDFGIDKRFFLDESLRFQNESFEAYLVERLASYGVNVSSIIKDVRSLFKELTISVGDQEQSGGLIAR